MTICEKSWEVYAHKGLLIYNILYIYSIITNLMYSKALLTTHTYKHWRHTQCLPGGAGGGGAGG